MNMDVAWKKVYEDNVKKDLPIHTMSCWTKDGFEELFNVTFKLLKKLKNVKTVLDVGCGPGKYCGEFHRKGFEVTGIDYSNNVVEKANKEYPEINFLVGDAYNLPFQDESFDLVSCIGVLQCVYNSEKIIKELSRVSKKYIILSTLLRQKKVDLPMRLLHKKLETDDWPTRDYHPSELEDLFEKEGYNVVVVLKHNKELIKDGFFIIATKKSR